MEGLKMGLQVFALREAFAENPKDTFNKIAAMGYGGVEMTMFSIDRDIREYVDGLAEAGLQCYSCLTSLESLESDMLQETLAQVKALDTDMVVIGSVDFARLKEESSYAEEAVKVMLQAMEVFKKEGIATGYHCHDGDFINRVGDVSFYEYVMEHTPSEFLMVLDTGNVQGGGGDPIELVHKYPGRTPTTHIKGYSQAKGYLTPVWESELDWEEFFPLVLSEGGAKVFDIEFGKRGDYDPFERAELSAKWLKEQLDKYTK